MIIQLTVQSLTYYLIDVDAQEREKGLTNDNQRILTRHNQ